jgi:hypothetical protein
MEEETPQLKRRRDSTASTVRYPSASESRERIPVPVPKAAYARSRSRGARIPETPQLEPRIVLPIDEEREIIPQFVRRGRSPAPLAAVVEEQETPQLPERIRRRMEAHRNQEAQGQAHEMLPGKFLQKFRAHLQSKQAAQKRAATAVPPLRRETISEMMEAIEANAASSALSPRGRKPRITIDFEKRRRVGV